MMILHRRFIIREIIQARKQALVFVLCAALSLTTLISLDNFKNGVHNSIISDARALHGGDIIMHSHYDFSPDLLKAVATLRLKHLVQSVRTYEFYSVIQTASKDNSLLAKIKLTAPGYPLYGRVKLKSGRPFAQVLRSGEAIVEQEVLGRLHLKVGDRIHVGSALLRIADVVSHEPDRPVNIFNLGPRIFVSTSDLARLDLVKKGSRVAYAILLKVYDPQATDRIAAELKTHAISGQERVDTYKTANSRVKVFFDNLIFFLSLVSIFTLLLAGIGMHSSLTALLREKEKTIAITKALGASNGFLFKHYIVIVIILGLAGSGLGVLGGIGLGHFFPSLFAGFIPVISGLTPSAGSIAQELLLGLLVILLFTFLPLHRLSGVKPSTIFRSEFSGARRGLPYYLALLVGLLLLAILLIRQLADLKTGLYFMAGSLLLITIIAILTQITLMFSRRIVIRSLPLRQAFKSILRPGNATRSIITTLAAALSVLLAIYLVEYNLHATYIASFPNDAPNLFCLDIQPDQRPEFARTFKIKAQFYPIIRARLISINGKKINRQEELTRKRDNLAREFNLTYRDRLLKDEVIMEGGSLFRQNWRKRDEVQVSILDTVAKMGDIRLNDLLRFNIQGVPLTARVTSIRTRTRSRLYPYFYFVFPEPVLRKAPQTFFAALKVNRKDIPRLENQIVARFPNISVINVSEVVSDLGAILRKLSRIINFFAAFSIMAGGLIIISSVLATRMARIREAVYYKILGGASSFVVSVFLYENMLLGLLSSLFALFLAHTGSWALCHFLFDIPYHPQLPASLLLIVLTILLVIAIGLLSSITIIRQKPSEFIRQEETDG